MPLLSVHVPTRLHALAHEYSQRRETLRSQADLTTVTALWNATEDLRTAYQHVEPHGTIVLKSPGPFLLDAIEIAKPITLRGVDSVRPLFLGGLGTSLSIKASDVHLENVHFLRLPDQLSSQTHRSATWLIDATGDRLCFSSCSFQDLSTSSDLACAIQWNPPASGGESPPASLDVRNVLFKQVGAGVSFSGPSAAQLVVKDSFHFGPGPLISSTSSAGRPFEAIDVNLSRVTVFGASTAVHSFPHPLDDVLPLRILADHCLFVPHDREQPVLAIRFAAQPPMLMPKVSWSGSDTICPADATIVEVSRGREATPWRASDITAWNAYWGTHATGLLGARLNFANSQVNSPTNIPVAKSMVAASHGADPLQMCYPSPVTIEQLPLLTERLRQE